MTLYGFFNAPLIETASSADELSPGFVNDSMMLAIGNTLADCHAKLKDMMERQNGDFNWSISHNSPFELSKIGLMNFPRSHRDTIPGNLVLNKTNPDGTVSTSSISAVTSYKYLGVIFDPRLHWNLQHTKAHTSATFWSSRIWRLSRVTNGLKPSDARQLYMTVSVPGFTYGAEVWYTPTFKLAGAGKTKGSVAITNKLRSTQRKVAKTVTGALSSTAGDILDVHANLLPIDLLFRKILFRAAIRICSLPQSHPLHAAIRKAARRSVRRHRSPLHNLLHLADISPNSVETVSAVRRSPGYTEAFKSFICSSKEQALEKIKDIERAHPIQVFCDGSGFEGGVGASAVLYIDNQVVKVLHFHLGSEKEHTVYEAEGIGISMALHMLKTRNRQLTRPLSICSDSQALLKALGNQRPHAGHYILDRIHDSAENLHAKQDSLLNRAERIETLAEGREWKGRTKGVIDLQMHWVPGHSGHERNEKADEEAKKAAQGLSSEAKLLPPFLRKHLPASVSALRQNFMTSILKTWKQRWKNSPRYEPLRSIDKSAPSKKYLRLIKGLDRRQASLFTQLRTGHIGLNRHLFRIRKVESPVCPHCRGLTVETVKHVLLDCPFYIRERHILQLKLWRNAASIPFLLSSPDAVKHLLTFIHSTGRFKDYSQSEDRPMTNARRNAELIAKARELGLL
jgi:ribonuclease HI